MAIITLLTDYGTRDYYLAAVKGVICSLAPEARIVDITHEIEPFNVAQAAFVLRQVWPWFPSGTVHAVIVDPGVGSERRILLAQFAGRFAIAPDNGLLTYVHRDFPVQAMHIVEDRRLFLPNIAATFHGRDIIAPAAAHLASGVKPRSFGRMTDRLETLAIPHKAEPKDGGWLGRVLYVDRFGTLITNIREDQLGPAPSQHYAWVVVVNGESIGPIRNAFHEVAIGSPIAYVGGAGHLEVALNQGRAIDRFGPLDALSIELR